MRVRVERDEAKYPPRGTWPRYRGREGWVAVHNAPDGEVGVSWAFRVEPTSADSWFRPFELTPLDAVDVVDTL